MLGAQNWGNPKPFVWTTSGSGRRGGQKKGTKERRREVRGVLGR